MNLNWLRRRVQRIVTWSFGVEKATTRHSRGNAALTRRNGWKHTSGWPSEEAGTWQEIVALLRNADRPLTSREISSQLTVTTANIYLPAMVERGAIKRASIKPVGRGRGKYIYWIDKEAA